jgi:hypothetical protein
MEDVVVSDSPASFDLESQALTRRAKRTARLVLILVFTLTVVAALIPTRFVAGAWSDDDIFECRASAFVSEAAHGGVLAEHAAMKNCLTHRRDKRWGPWGVFGNANDGSKYNAPDD